MQIVSLSKREKILITILLCIVVFGFYIFNLFLPKYKQYHNNREILVESKELLNEMKEISENHSLKAYKKDLNSKLTVMEESLPPSIDIPLLYLNLMEMRDLSNVVYSKVEFQVPEKLANQLYQEDLYLTKTTITIHLTGSYKAIEKYLESVYSNKRKLTVSSIHYETSKDKLEVNLTMNAFSLVKDGSSHKAEYNFTGEKSYGKENPTQ